MPIYEFYCHTCHTVYKFFSKSINTDKIPNCPTCKDKKLKRTVSLFSAVSGSGKDEGAEGDMPQIDEKKMEKALEMAAREAGNKNLEDDPRQAAQLMRKISDAAGLKMGSGMEEALSRLERGEDPEKIEQEMGSILEEEDPFSFDAKDKKRKSKYAPKIDDTLYDL